MTAKGSGNMGRSGLWCRSLMLIASVIAGLLANSPAAQSEVLKGSVQEQNEILRIAPPSGQPSGNADNGTHSLRISRQAMMPQGNSESPMVDTSAFSKPLSGNASENGAKLGVLQPNQFAAPPANKFDIGAERGSREMVLAWERWHHQLSAAIYERWSERADVAGQATLKLTVTRDHHIIPTMLSSGGNHFDHGLMEAIMSLNGNAGLEFPTGSERDHVTFEADYIAGSDVRPGYNWVKNDVEKVRHDF